MTVKFNSGPFGGLYHAQGNFGFCVHCIYILFHFYINPDDTVIIGMSYFDTLLCSVSVTGFPVWLTILTFCGVATVYTAIVSLSAFIRPSFSRLKKSCYCFKLLVLEICSSVYMSLPT